jgi:iron complex outermembrane receptor protein
MLKGQTWRNSSLRIARPALLLAGLGALLLPHAVWAQTASMPASDEPAPRQDGATDQESEGDIVVTAQRRSENLQRVPIAITVVGGDALVRNNFTSITDIQYLAPSLKFTPAPFASSFSIRGIGSQAFDYSVESSVGLAVDEVIQTLPRALALNTLADVERVEVLRGPQGTLFGKNTSSGLISIVTRRPVMEQYSFEGHLQYGSRNEVQAYGIVNVPISENLAARVRAAYQVRDPVIRNISTGRIEESRDYQFNGKLLWEPTDTFSLYAIADYQDSRGEPGVRTLRTYGAGTTAPVLGGTFIRTQNTAMGIVAGPRNTTVALNADDYQKVTSFSGQVTASLQVGDHTLTSITAYKDQDYYFTYDTDSTPFPVLDNNIGTYEAYQATQEMRLSSASDCTLQYTLGAFVYRQKITATQQQSGTFGRLPNDSAVQLAGIGGLGNFGYLVNNQAAFGEFKLRISDAFRAIGGLRYTHDNIQTSYFVSQIPGVCGFSLLAGVCQAAPLPSPLLRGRTDKGAITGRGGLELDVAPDVMTYATISRGYKGAGITTVSGVQYPVAPETVWSKEIGIKAQLFDRRVTLNVAAFHAKYRDFQAQVFNPAIPPTGAFLTGNAGGAVTKGVELDASVRPIPGLSLSGGVSYIDATFTDYQPACYAGQTAAQGCTLPGPTFDASGTGLPNAPKWSYNAALNYETPDLGGVKAFFNANYSYRSSVIFGVGDPNTVQEGYGLLNASFGVTDPEKKVRVSVFARNMTDKRFATSIGGTTFDAGGYSQVLSDQAFRRIGAALDLRF